MSVLSGIYTVRQRSTAMVLETPIQWWYTDDGTRCTVEEVTVSDISDEVELICKLGLPETCSVVSDANGTYIVDECGVVLFDHVFVKQAWQRKNG